MEARISTAIRVKAGDPIIGRLCCMIALGSELRRLAAEDAPPLPDGSHITCTQGHECELAESEWRAIP